MSLRRFLAELHRRRVIKIGGAYIVGAWLGVEILQHLFEQFNAPEWADRLLAIVFVVGFPVAMVLGWTVQVQEDGRWAIDPSTSDRRTLGLAILLGASITAGLFWLILPGEPEAPPYRPMPRSLALLPLEPSDPGPGGTAMARRLDQALLDGLDRVDGLLLIRGDQPESGQALIDYGRRLGAAHIAGGRMTRADQGWRAELRILDVSSGTALDPQPWSLSPDKLRETSRAMAGEILQSLGLDAPPLEEFSGTGDDAAYAAFVSARVFAAEDSLGALERATEHYQLAVELDPGFARARNGLALALFSRLEHPDPRQGDREELLRQATAAQAIARRFDPDSPEAMYLLGLSSDNPQVSIQACEQALALDPDHDPSLYRYAVLKRERAELEDAERLIRRALQLYPGNPAYHAELGRILALK